MEFSKEELILIRESIALRKTSLKNTSYKEPSQEIFVKIGHCDEILEKLSGI